MELKKFGIVIAGCLLLVCHKVVSAQLGVNLDFGASITTARVPDIVAPSTPILIAPDDEDILVVNKPTFEWYESTDNVAVDHYQLWIDSTLYLGNLPITDQETAFYILTYDNFNGSYSLTTKMPIADGSHTWSVTAVDAAGNESTSATWDFTIDTLVPNLSITMIEGESVLITTSDISTLPTEPIVTDTDSPLISGTGEPNTTLQIILSIPGEDTTITTYNIGAGGTWSFQFPTLEDNTLVTLSLIIQDDAGHNNILSPLEFIHNPAPTATPIPSGVVVVTATPASGTTVPTTPANSPTPTPRVTTGTYPPKYFLSALTPTPFPTRPPSEQSPFEPFIRLFDTPKTEFVISRGNDNVTFISTEKRPLWEYLSPLTLILPIVLTSLIILKRFGRFPDTSILKTLWWILGFNPKRHPDGDLYNHRSHAGLFLIPILAKSNQSEHIFVATVSNRDGYFIFTQLQDDVYCFTPSWSGMKFPTTTKRPQSLPWHKYYKGEKVEFSKNLPQPFIHIPVELQHNQSNLESKLLAAIYWSGPILLIQIFTIILLFFLSPSLVTGIPIILLLSLGLFRLLTHNKVNLLNNYTRY